ncbi:MAG: hypothetical protein IKR48_02700 [Kiritimatiellae bacterium]|nr:hypothetical protein [Kiritimatiellia bacterium]
MRGKTIWIGISCLAAGLLSAQEISLQLNLAQRHYIVGEPVMAQFDLLNLTRERLVLGSGGSGDQLYVEVTKGSGVMDTLRPFNDAPIAGSFQLKPGDRVHRPAELDKWFPLLQEGKYLVNAVLVHDGVQYKSQKKSFDVVPGIRLQEGVQMFSNRKNLRRIFRLVYWDRNQTEHLFLRVTDEPGNKVWDSIDLGTLLRTSPAKLDISPGGEVTVVHRATQDAFIRTVLWSLPDSLEINERNQLLDPAISASQRAKSMYNEMADEKAEQQKKKKWWKFW